MKIRKGFVSNSSSSSFIVRVENLTAKQYRKIINHADAAYRDAWSISESEEALELYTLMDNFDMYEYLLSIGVDEEDIDGGRD